MRNYKLNYIYIDAQNIKRFGVLHLSENDARYIEGVKERIVSGKSSAVLFSTVGAEISSKLRLNLMMVDSKFPELFEAAISMIQPRYELTSVELCRLLKEEDPLGLGRDYEHFIYNYKWKRFLLALGSGFCESEVWTGTFNGIEHHAIFKQTSDGLNPDFFWPEPFAEYLFFNTSVRWSESESFNILLT
ncbi:HpaII family restriction endonuclease [Mucilaginibacter myungsuensis]|uniref:HpaII family restriction endonuclease n=1 Tax=Mucilaginibacter myungsuensis TaxID=649104 RepID=A0A929PVL0_9SPHI|nr:HpaII family restriction endonuclease [Mucilaginibacter myungsuensis]MBE9661131.1 HpaII family restriction endonuclease [Mucilaginibacter myungsuensis]MDN3597276.1 HpaII family restriction endonuclease [Mucilaginibacter myungsuensis]